MTEKNPDAAAQNADILVAEDENFDRRVLKLEGGVNFRDLGGYRTGDGRHIGWGKLFRSGSMFGLTKADYDTLAAFGFRRVIDLRTPEERIAEPNHWAEAAGISSWSRDYKSTFGVLRELLASDLPTAAAAVEAIKAGYRRLPYEHVPAYRVMFQALKEGDVPMVFNCSAGKDRAGTAAALLLAALGVPRVTILRDYGLTDRILDVARLGSARPSHGGGSMISRVPPEVIAVVMGTHPSYLACVFDAIESQDGSVEAYLRNEIGIDAEALSAIRDSLLE